MSDRTLAIQAWTRCSWCWRELGETSIRWRGHPYCNERCAGHDSEVAIDADFDIPVAAPGEDQLVMGDDA